MTECLESVEPIAISVAGDPGDTTAQPLTGRIRTWLSGESHPDPALAEAIYQALHRIASKALSREGHGHTLQPTALLHEAYLALARRREDWRDRRHFFATAALCMRHILVDHARAKLAEKRSGGVRVAWHESTHESVAASGDADLLVLDQALEQLRGIDARRADVLQYVYFGGLKRDEVASLLELSVRTVDRELRLGEAWLADALR